MFPLFQIRSEAKISVGRKQIGAKKAIAFCGAFVRTHKSLAIPFALAALAPVAAYADEQDTFQFRAGQSFQRDSNVFRLSDSANVQADTIGITTLGFKLDKPYSLQRFELDVYADKYSYKNNSNLDFTAVNYEAAWRWSFTPRLYGNITADRRQYVDNSADVQNQGQVNRRIDQANRADAEYDLGGAWRAGAGLFNRSAKNSLSSSFEGDYTVNGGELGARYVFASGNWLGYRFKSGKGNYPDRTLSNVFAKNFSDREHEFRALWAPTGKTTVNARISYLQREHEGLSARDYSGFTGQVDATLVATGKTSFIAGYVRELENYQTPAGQPSTSYYEGDRFFIGPVWKATEKITLRARYDHGRRTFRGALPSVVALDRKDTLNLASLSVDYQIFRALKLRGWLQRDTRSSSLAGADYRSNAVGISALASF